MASKRKFVQTKIKRGHLVLRNGVGALVRTSQGSTALVAGLPLWMDSLRAFKGDDAQRHLKKMGFREPELSMATGISWFVPPPKEEDRGRSWEVPLIRFPLTGYCSEWDCGRVTVASHGDPLDRRWRCHYCKSDKGAGRVKQLPIFYACPDGHLSEIDFASAIEHVEGCAASSIAISFGNRVESPMITCRDCQRRATPRETPCNGKMPWLSVQPDSTSCRHLMTVVSRTSVKAYFPTTRSAIHVPTTADLRDDVIEWMWRAGWAAFAENTEAWIATAANKLIETGWDLDPEQAVLHVRQLFIDDAADDEWNILEARAREFDVFVGRRRDEVVAASPLLRMEDMDLTGYQNSLVTRGLITRVTTVHKLTESRVLSGFSRIEPRSVAPREGRMLMWGRDTGADDWLPGYRLHGEGIFFAFDASQFGGNGCQPSADQRSLFALSPAGKAIHTLAHLLILLISEESGYAVPSLRDRIYDLDDGRLGVLIYTAEGDSMGTLGGLAALAQHEALDILMNRLLDSGAWCPQDPVCSEETLDQDLEINAACHQCCLLPETSCELFNAYLNRQLVRGGILLTQGVPAS
jgi:hypothetical protein